MSKKLFEESKLKEGTNEAIRQYKLHVAQSNGAALLAVCRGKISEGLDLSDSESRAVVMIGLPFAPTRDPRIKLKKEFKAAISSNNWSVMDAMRAVNQAVGRVLRHKDDFGVVALIDKRQSRLAVPSTYEIAYETTLIVNKLLTFGEYEKECPTWMRSSFENYKTFADFEVKCKKFFADHGYRNSQKEMLKESAHGMVNIRKRKVDECNSNTNSKTIKKDSSVAGIYASYYRSYNQPPPQQPVTETPTQKSTSILDNIVEKDEWQRNAVIEPSRTSASSTALSSAHSIASYTFQQVPSGTSRKTVKLKPNSSRPPKNVVAEASTSGQSSKSSHGVSIPPQYQHTPAAKIAILLSGIPNESVRLKAVVDIKVYFKKNDAKVFISQLSSTLCEYPDLLSG
ncbi:unnamed protein product [Anisakis simplex]|uniref:Regulator of telomere elongation helicase 1 homolog (inferred by orthology to a C. elegans protein) n=1 Tax=Anisakis simplex TaxID=6269 RepID=A0A0M3K9I8_ANISI|nr:unnamed protein product [Anisakis simplex]